MCKIVQHYSRVQQKTPTNNNPRSRHVCTIIVQQYSRKQKLRSGDMGTQLTLFLSRIERTTVKPTENVVITCRLRDGNFEKSSLAELAATPVLSTGIARAAVWVGLGAVARSRGIGWRTGTSGVEKHTFNSIKLQIPMMITMLTWQAY